MGNTCPAQYTSVDEVLVEEQILELKRPYVEGAALHVTGGAALQAADGPGCWCSLTLSCESPSRACGSDLLCHRTQIIVPDFEEAIEELPEPWRRLLPGGQMLAGLVLAGNFGEKTGGHNMTPDQRAEFPVPSASSCRNSGGELTWRPVLLSRAGRREATAFTWVGDEAVGDKSIYIAFGQLRTPQQALKVWSKAAELAEMDLGSGRSIRVHSYIKRKIDKLFGPCELERQLARAITAHPDHRIIFTGISHGGVLAMASALRFATSPLGDGHAPVVAVWNSYRWTDAAGTAFFSSVFGSCFFQAQLSRREEGVGRTWDPLSEFPPVLAPMPNVMLLDSDTARFLQFEGGTLLNNSVLNLDFANRFRKHHWHPLVIRTLEAATKVAIGERPSLPVAYQANEQEAEYMTSMTNSCHVATEGSLHNGEHDSNLELRYGPEPEGALESGEEEGVEEERREEPDTPTMSTHSMARMCRWSVQTPDFIERGLGAVCAELEDFALPDECGPLEPASTASVLRAAGAPAPARRGRPRGGPPPGSIFL